MRLKSVYISQYKNLRDFELTFDGSSFLDVFVGKNGSGKSNLFEALIEIFRHLVEFGSPDNTIGFDYRISYEIDGRETSIKWIEETLFVNGNSRRTLGTTPLPDNVLIYYSGHNRTVTDLVDRYERDFRRRIRGANIEESRRFIGIGPQYKSLLLAMLLSREEGHVARKFVCQKLGISSTGESMLVSLVRPDFARGRLSALGANSIDSFDPRTHYWGADGIAREFLEKLITCIKGEFRHDDIYDSQNDRYRIRIDVALFQQAFPVQQMTEVFRQFDNLKTLGMLSDISMPLMMNDDTELNVDFFSDGQFQTVYIYAIAELFKDSNCLMLLDEPDAFLHPEWQFEFLKQIVEISDAAARRNHLLLSSHSAVTLIPHERKRIKFIEIQDHSVRCYDLPKKMAIQRLSANLIKYSEQEQLLSIINAIQIENKPVLFTEGSTDPIILKEAWERLYGDEMPFIPFYGFSCTYIKQLLTDNRIHSEMGGLPIFALFDFDEAYNQWNGLNGPVLRNDPVQGMIKKWREGESYALMLPIPSNPKIKAQVINPLTGKTFGGSSYCAIEHLFYGASGAATYFVDEPCAGGSRVVFKSDRDKTHFAKSVVPTLPDNCFEPLKPVFDFIASKCGELVSARASSA
jgi:predicted ATPase